MATFEQLEQEVASIGNNLRNLEARDVDEKDGFYITANIDGAAAVTAANFTHFFTVRHPMEVLRVTEVHATAGNSLSAVALDIDRLTGTTAPGLGDSILTTTFDLKGTANTVVTKEKKDLTTFRQLQEGHRLAFVTTGTLTNLASVQVTLYCKPLGRGTYR